MSSLIQLIDFEEHFNDDVEAFLETSNVLERRDKFHVVSIIGPQSSGKSTLLNILFNLNFQTMDAGSGRYQVTQGVWMGYDQESHTVVLDLEGTDSRERGEFAGAYERKSALFALALSEILMVNIWTQDIGRLNASNLLLLKNILELHVQLFITAQKSSEKIPFKTKLMFILRDHVSSPLSKLTEVLTNDVKKVWGSIEKPEEMKNSLLEEFFDLDFYSLPHKNLKPEEFAEAASEMQAKFRSGAFLDCDVYNRKVEADELALYGENIWNTIASNRELDLPSQREMVSIVRCDQALDEVGQTLAAELSALEQELKPIQALDERSSDLMQRAKTIFREKTTRQIQSVVLRKEASLAENLSQVLTKLMRDQMETVNKTELNKFREKLDVLGSAETPWTAFESQTVEAFRLASSEFDKWCRAPDAIPQISEGVSTKRADLLNDLENEVEITRQEVVEKGRDALLQTFQQIVRKKVVPVIDLGLNAECWPGALEEVKHAIATVDDQCTMMLGSDGVGLHGDELELARVRVREACLSWLFGDLHKLIGGSEGVLRRMKQRFNQLFRFDESGNPRVWAPRDDVTTIFDAAQKGASDMGDMLATISLGEYGSQNVVDNNSLRELKQQLDSDAAVAFVDARHAQEMARMKTKVPMWAVVLVGVLGFDEAKMVLKRPALIFLFLIAFVLIYFAYLIRVHEMVWEPLRDWAAPYLQILKARLEEWIETNENNGNTIYSGTPAKASERTDSVLTGASVVESSAVLETSSEKQSLASNKKED
ncbi:hypothetical protein NDN08_007459 [Rhodosorus marinus]|uniref:Protein SEY1 homolog n=1 Tax=Rhodosorus marinus TaxID=101924 RepID=A0AAV8UYX0_9RHOD|nr:hypothetical protein NDN08_007459 [Rhodosorus marinus]